MKRFSFDGPFDLSLTVSCGQAFRWREEDGYWSAPVNGSVWKVRQIDDTLLYGGCSEEELIHYFALDLDLDEILSSIDTDPLIHKAITACRGLRICRQPPFECLISYICASCSNIPMIAKRIELLSETFGKQAGGKRFAFPTADVLAEHGMDEIRCCKTGYRDKFIHEASVYAAENPHWIERLSAMPYPDAGCELMKLSGIGPRLQTACCCSDLQNMRHCRLMCGLSGFSEHSILTGTMGRNCRTIQQQSSEGNISGNLQGMHRNICMQNGKFFQNAGSRCCCLKFCCLKKVTRESARASS